MSKTSTNLKKLCVLAVLTALTFALDLLSLKLGNDFKITFGGFPIIVAAVFFGPISGMSVGLLGAFFGQLYSYGLGVTTLLWIIPAGARGLAMGLLFIAFKRSIKFPVICLESVISAVIVTVLNTVALYFDSKIWHYPFVFALPTVGLRIILGMVTAVIFAVVLLPVYNALKKIIK